MTGKIRCLLIDDEAPARDLLRHYLLKSGMVEVVGECSNGLEAVKMIQDLLPDLLFLDIQMPKISGFELLEVLREKPEVIFCTAYDQFAIKAFEMHAVDYLLKPFSEQRLLEATARAAERIRNKQSTSVQPYQTLVNEGLPQISELTRLVTRTGSKISIIPLDAIQYLQAQDDYVLVVSDLGNHLKEKTMKFYEEHLPADTFIRIHRSFIVNVKQIKNIYLYGKETWNVVLKNGSEIRASQQGYKKLREMISG